MNRGFDDAGWTCPFCGQKNWKQSGTEYCHKCYRVNPGKNPREDGNYSGRN